MHISAGQNTKAGKAPGLGWICGAVSMAKRLVAGQTGEKQDRDFVAFSFCEIAVPNSLFNLMRKQPVKEEQDKRQRGRDKKEKKKKKEKERKKTKRRGSNSQPLAKEHSIVDAYLSPLSLALPRSLLFIPYLPFP